MTLLPEGFHGGNVYADVVTHHDGTQHFAEKHLGPPKYEPFSLPLGNAMATVLFDWIAAAWRPHPPKQDGAVLVLDQNLSIRRETKFAGALIAETVIPALDASSNVTGNMTIRVQPELIRTGTGSGTISLTGSKQEPWRTGAFGLHIDGLDCTKVRSVGALTVTRELQTITSGSGGVSLIVGRITFPNLWITLSQGSATTWADWHSDFVVKGNNAAAFERNGRITFPSANLKDELSRIELHKLGIIRLEQSFLGPAPEAVAELYCEQMVLARPGGSP